MRRQKGFTLVELVVVVMILGILAAVAAPKLLGTSAAATDNGIKQTLAVVRDAIERYAAEFGKLPGAGAADDALELDLKPFLRGEFPTCPIAGGNKDVEYSVDEQEDLVGELTPAESWYYNTKTGEFICNSSAVTENKSDDDALTYDQL